MSTKQTLDIDYTKYNFRDSTEDYEYKFPPGLTREVVERISKIKKEPDWMLQFRLRAYDHYLKRPLPTWGGDLSTLKFDEMLYYASPTEKKSRSWEDVPPYIKNTFDKLGIPEAEQKFLGGVGAQYESEVVYHSLRDDLAKKGIIFKDTDTALRENPEIFKKYFGTVVPPEDNKFAALNSAVWSGGSFIYVPPGVNVEVPLQAYFRINTQNMGQFERTLIIADENSRVHYIEGCLPAGEQVSTGEEWVDIDSVRPGDFVLNSDGVKAKVRAIRRRPFRGDLVTIQPISKGNMFQLTPEHPVLTVRRNGVLVRRRQRGMWLREVDPKLLRKAKARFLEAGHLQRGDFLVFPIPRVTRDDKNYTISTLRLLGYYLAEGSTFINKKLHMPVVVFSFGTRDQRHIREVKRLIRNLTGKRSYEIKDRKKHGVSVLVYSKELRELCLDCCGKGARTKKLNKKIMELPPKKQAQLLETYLSGDGSHYQRAHEMVRTSTASAKLARQLQELIARQGHYATITVRKGGPDVIQRRPIVRGDQYVIYYSPDKKQSEVRRIGNKFLVPIKALRRDPYNGHVFNIELDRAPNAYLARGFAVHNCTAPIYSTDSLHSAVVEIIARPGAYVRYTTIQNWSGDVYNLVTKRAYAHSNATVEWVDGNLGCLAEGTTIYCNPSVKTIEDVKVGDTVYGYDATTNRIVRRKVTAIRSSGIRPTYLMTLEGGKREITATDNHPFLTLQYYPSRPKKLGRYGYSWKPLRDVREGDKLLVPLTLPDVGKAASLPSLPNKRSALHRNQFGASYPVNTIYKYKQVRVPKKTSKELMWLLGVFLGDGNVEMPKVENLKANRYGKLIFSVPRTDPIRHRLTRTMTKLFGLSTYGERKDGVTITYYSVLLAEWFEKLGLRGTAHSKRVPSWVYTLPREQKFAFLAGYAEADGAIRGYGIRVKTCNKALTEDLRTLALYCGVNTSAIRSEVTPRKLWKTKTSKSDKDYVSYVMHLMNADLIKPYLTAKNRMKLAVRKIRSKGFHQFQNAKRVSLPSDLGLFSVSKIAYIANLPTYDLEVEKPSNFIANGLFVHNSKLTMKYPSIYLLGEGAKGEILSVAFAGKGQHQDAGGKVVHLAPHTTSRITSKSVSKDGGRTTYRGLLHVAKGAKGVKSTVRCDALLLDEYSRTDTYPYNEINEDDATTTHEATVGKIGEDQLFYLMSRGLSEQEALSMIVMGFMEPFTKELPMEYAIELNRLIQMEMAGSVG